MGTFLRFSMFLSAALLASIARAETDSCSLLTAAEVSAVVGVQVAAGTHVTPTSVKTCTWSPSDKTKVSAVTLFLQPAATHDRGKAMAYQMAAVTKGGEVKPVSIGEDGFYFIAGDRVELFWKKGAYAIKTTVYAKIPADKKEAMELELAKKVVGRL